MLWTTVYDLIDIAEGAHIDTRQFKVYVYLLEHADADTGVVKCSYGDIAKAVGVNYPLVCTAMKRFQKLNLTEMVAPGTWRLKKMNAYSADEIVPSHENDLQILFKNYKR